MKGRRWFLSYFSFGKAIIVWFFSPGKSASVHDTHWYSSYILLCWLPADEFPVQSTRFAEKYFLYARVYAYSIIFFLHFGLLSSHKASAGGLLFAVYNMHYNILLYYSRGSRSRNRNKYSRVRAHSSRRKRIKKKKWNTRHRDIGNNIIYNITWIYNCDTRLSVTEPFIARCRWHQRAREMTKSSQRFPTPI